MTADSAARRSRTRSCAAAPVRGSYIVTRATPSARLASSASQRAPRRGRIRRRTTRHRHRRRVIAVPGAPRRQDTRQRQSRHRAPARAPTVGHRVERRPQQRRGHGDVEPHPQPDHACQIGIPARRRRGRRTPWAVGQPRERHRDRAGAERIEPRQDGGRRRRARTRSSRRRPRRRRRFARRPEAAARRGVLERAVGRDAHGRAPRRRRSHSTSKRSTKSTSAVAGPGAEARTICSSPVPASARSA